MTTLRMPAEWERHSATVMIFPERPGSWCNGGAAAKKAFAEIVKAVSVGERVYVAVSPSAYEEAKNAFAREIESGKVELWNYACNDSWARDTAPTFVFSDGKLSGVDWSFNAWGGDYNGLYRDYAADDAFAGFCCSRLSLGHIDAKPFVLEGGSVHSNGAGVLITTEECLLSRGRNPSLTKPEIELGLKKFLGAERVIWLPWGVEDDETDGHVDNICAFCSENSVLLGWGGTKSQLKRCKSNLKVLKKAKIKVIKLPFPAKPVRFTAEELSGFTYEEGEITRSAEDNLAASYVNFYICNAGVIVPQFGDKNDRKAVRILSKAFRGKKIIPIYSRDIIVGGGNIHCLTQQIPE